MVCVLFFLSVSVVFNCFCCKCVVLACRCLLASFGCSYYLRVSLFKCVVVVVRVLCACCCVCVFLKDASYLVIVCCCSFVFLVCLSAWLLLFVCVVCALLCVVCV